MEQRVWNLFPCPVYFRDGGNNMWKFTASLVTAAGIVLLTAAMVNGKGDMEYRDLTPEEEYVIVRGGTEMPNSGVYVNAFEGGIYTCKQCGASLFRSETKFQAHCGWPAFDQAIEGAVRMIPDDDGVRTEIRCSSCNGHLGHVFTGEGYTETDTRHCVNSISMDFIPGDNIETAYFAGGCFWGVENTFDHTAGVLSAESGYMGGYVDNPEYSEVCSGSTGHTETVKVVFDNRVTTFREQAMTFFEIHDPTQVNGQGVDTGTQYRSAVFYTTEEQLAVVNDLISILTDRGYVISTEVSPAQSFWQAEDYHQNYFDNTGAGYSCHTRVNRFTRE